MTWSLQMAMALGLKQQNQQVSGIWDKSSHYPHIV